MVVAFFPGDDVPGVFLCLKRTSSITQSQGEGVAVENVGTVYIRAFHDMALSMGFISRSLCRVLLRLTAVGVCLRVLSDPNPTQGSWGRAALLLRRH